MKKEGFTLIELIAALTVLVVIFSFGFKGISCYLNYENKIEVENFKYELKDFFSYSRQYCAANKVAGEIVINNEGENLVISLESMSNVIKKITLNDSLILKNHDDGEKISDVICKVNIDGYIEAKTVSFIDKYGTKYNLVIQVGGNLVKFKEGES